VLVSFRDTGPGLTSEQIAHLFEPFYTTKSTGTGLGLAISYGIIERHGGTIEVSSQPGQGATFVVELPVHPSAALRAGPSAAPFDRPVLSRVEGLRTSLRAGPAET